MACDATHDNARVLMHTSKHLDFIFNWINRLQNERWVTCTPFNVSQSNSIARTREASMSWAFHVPSRRCRISSHLTRQSSCHCCQCDSDLAEGCAASLRRTPPRMSIPRQTLRRMFHEQCWCAYRRTSSGLWPRVAASETQREYQQVQKSFASSRTSYRSHRCQSQSECQARPKDPCASPSPQSARPLEVEALSAMWILSGCYSPPKCDHPPTACPQK
mmetsp:Transcript_7999/g.15123  ORF Transcript_7999/g.15123 Transcript_7999/m.15123 type:complete len:218 (-) Transcript_7999:185-838(-)